MNKNQIKHHTKVLPGIVRNEVYEYEDIKYTERFDDVTGKRMFGMITMYNGVTVCHVHENGSIILEMPTNWVTNRKDVKDLVADIERLDEFLAAVCKNYK